MNGLLVQYPIFLDIFEDENDESKLDIEVEKKILS